MNTVLTERFMSMMPLEHQLGYAEIMTRNCNCWFQDTQNHVYTDVGNLDKVEVKSNKEDTKKPWHPSEGFQILKQRILDGCMYAAFAGQPITNEDTLNMLTVVIARTRLFGREYQDWHAQPPE